MSHADYSVDPRRCWMHGLVRVQRFPEPRDFYSSISWWECPQCNLAAEGQPPAGTPPRDSTPTCPNCHGSSYVRMGNRRTALRCIQPECPPLPFELCFALAAHFASVPWGLDEEADDDELEPASHPEEDETTPRSTVDVSVPVGVHLGGWVHCWCGGSHGRAWTEYSVREFAPAVHPSDSGTRDLTPDEARRFADLSRANAVRTRLVPEETPPAPPTPDWEYTATQQAGRIAELEQAWTGILRETAKIATAMGDPDEWHEADDSTLNAEFDPWDVLRKVESSLSSSASSQEEIQRDAERWRAFIGSQRIRFFGTAGPDAHGYAHFGGEFWTLHPDTDSDVTQRNREWLTLYADTARSSLTPSESPT